VKRVIDGWTFNDFDGHFKPDVNGPKDQFIYSNGDDIEFDNGEFAVWMPLKIVAEYLRMLGWTVEPPKGKDDA
jgi:hypothetical protein